MGTVLELRDLVKEYPGHRAVNGVSLSIAAGEFFSLLGPSGCGKTTTLRLIAGFEEPTSGDVLLDGHSVAKLPAYRRDVSTVFQSYALFPHLTVAQNVAFGLEQRGHLKRPELLAKVEEGLALVQLKDKGGRYPHQLSGGEKQRVALARSLVLEPKVLLLDEPLSALDAKLRKEMRQQLKILQRRVEIAFLFITHDQEEALSMSDRIGVMHRGMLQQVGTPRELYRQPASRFVAEFLGNVNWVDGVGVRPEAVRVSREAPLNPDHNATAVVERATFLGNCVQLEVKLTDGTDCIAELPQRNCDFQPGEQVHMWWHAADEFHIPPAGSK